jgi:hypothetical protein
VEPAGVRALAALVVVGTALLVAGCGGGSHSGTTAAGSAPCASDALSGTFDVVPGSAGAGNIVYRLTLKNTSSSDCWVSGVLVPVAQLQDAGGASLPTHIAAAESPKSTTPARIVVPPGHSVKADARFSPDVPGVGEQHPGPCEAKAATLSVEAPGGGNVAAAIVPPTAVCSKGALQFSLYSPASS